MKKAGMMTSSLCIFFSVLYMFCGMIGFAQAAENLNLDKARGAIIAINNPEFKIDLKEVKTSGALMNASGEQKNKLFSTTLNLLMGENKWQELWIEFVPVQSGELLVEVRGCYFENSKNEVLVDDIAVTGDEADIKNGDFESLDETGVFAIGWAQRPSLDLLSTNGSQARGGKNCAIISNEHPLTQGISVKAGNKYRVSAWFKGYYKQAR